MKDRVFFKTSAKKVFLTLSFFALQIQAFAISGSAPCPIKPVWEFSVLVGVSEFTMQEYGAQGGLAEVESLVRDQLDVINSRFQYAFSREIRFVVESVFYFAEDPEFIASSFFHPSHDYLLVYDAEGGRNGGWLSSNQSILHSWSHSFLGGPFGPEATDGLVHEFGHSRGAIDIYALEVHDNRVARGLCYEGPESIMNYPYGTTVWDEHSIRVINSNGDLTPANEYFVNNTFPSYIIYHIRDSRGVPVPGATVKLYPVHWFSDSVDNPPDYIWFTDSQGMVVINMKYLNPFGPNTTEPPPGPPWYIKAPNFLVEVSCGNRTEYQWLPLHEVQNCAAAYRFSIYIVDFRLDMWGGYPH